MPDPIAVGWTLAATFRGNMNGQTTLTTFNYMVDAIAGGAVPNNELSLTQFNTAITAAGELFPDYIAAMPNNWILMEMNYQWIAPTRYRKVSFPNGQPNGGNAGEAQTSNLAIVITLTGERANRRSLSNKHLPGIATEDYLNGIVGAPSLANAQAVATQAQADVIGGAVTYIPVIYGRYIAPFTKCGVNYPGQPELKTPITGGVAQETVRVMRRRTVNIGI